MSLPRIVFIGGAGKIGTAILNGLLSSRVVRPSQVCITARHPESLRPWRKRGLRVLRNNRVAVRDAGVVVLCVHPEDARHVCADLADVLTDRHLLLSVVTGITTTTLEEYCGHTLRIIRAMPNMPVTVQQSMTCLAKGRHATTRDLRIAERIFRAVGAVEIFEERLMNAATGLGGCGPAFAFKIIEGLTDGGIKVGIPRTIARRMAAQVLKGAAELVLRSGVHPAELREQVATPAGCTIDGLARLEERGLSIALIDAVETATLKAGRLLAEHADEHE